MAFWLKDSERCPFGLGWEYHRRGRGIDDNPFEVGSKAFREFRDGWQKFQPSKTAEYHNPEISGPLPRDLVKRRRIAG